MMFGKPDEASIKTKSGASRSWPDFRGVFHNHDNQHWRKNAVAWINEEDHLRIISSESGTNFRSALDRFRALSEALEAAAHSAGHAIAKSDDLGFITTNPADIGTGLQCKVLLKLPALTHAQDRLSAFCAEKKISLRKATAEENWEITNIQTYGVSEVDIVQSMIAAASAILSMEKDA